MSDKELLKIVTSFRKGILGKRPPLKMCFAICSPLASYLRVCKIDCELTEGTVKLTGHNKGVTINHFWITLPDKRIIDPTISQFNKMGGEDMPIVYLGTKPKWLIKKRKQ